MKTAEMHDLEIDAAGYRRGYHAGLSDGRADRDLEWIAALEELRREPSIAPVVVLDVLDRLRASVAGKTEEGA